MKSIAIILFALVSCIANAQTTPAFTVDLWNGDIPGAKLDADYTEEVFTKGDEIRRVRRVVTPTLTAYLPSDESRVHKAIVVCPGGGYVHLSIDAEGHFVAQRLAENGVAAFVLKYRLPSDKIMENRAFGPLSDAQRAIRLVRQNAEQWKVDPNQIGIMGFSAGGNLAANASVHFDHAAYDAQGDTTSARPDFAVLIYPVVSTDAAITHQGSCNALYVGTEREADYAAFFSAEKNVKPTTPPTFLVHAANDRAVDFRNTLRHAEALKKNGVDVEVHIYPAGGHGFGLATGTHQGEWFDSLLKWLNR